ncbi:hypothetical protein V1505DRAFT_199709 [Lipomyces doorenjongii]
MWSFRAVGLYRICLKSLLGLYIRHVVVWVLCVVIGLVFCCFRGIGLLSYHLCASFVYCDSALVIVLVDSFSTFFCSIQTVS